MEIAEKVRKGLPLDDILIIDCHCHIGAWHNFRIPGNTAEGMLITMDALGIDTAFITGLASIGPDFVFGNDMVIEAVKKHPGRFIGYVTVNPHYTREMAQELERCFQVPGIRGIKTHPGMHACTVEDVRYRPAFEFADRVHCPVLIHTWGSGDLLAIGRLADKYPGAVFIMGHAGGEPKYMETAAEVAGRCRNVYVDLAISRVYEGNVEWFVEKLGSGKILYGSDMPFLDPRPAIGRVALAGITQEQKLEILGLNMRRVLQDGEALSRFGGI